MAAPARIPCPPWHIDVALSGRLIDERELADLPAAPAVFSLEDGQSRTILLASTANLRQLARARLGPDADDAQPSRKADLRPLVRRILAMRVSSAFESDWACLQMARLHAPGSYKAMLDRWQAWFVHCDPQAPFPQWLKTAHPGPAPAASTVFAGPLPDKHAAARYIELLQDVFDLCRYHHILVQSPHGSACAYKEMGRCPAPCDGSVSLDHYRRQIDEAIHFASTPLDEWRDECERRMKSLSAERNFEAAQRIALRLQRAEAAVKPAFHYVDRIERFRLLAVMPAGRSGVARLFVIVGGWIQPWAEVPADAPADELESLLQSVLRCVESVDLPWSEAAVENLGLVCAHLHRRGKTRQPGTFMRVDDRLTAAALRRSLARAAKGQPEDDQVVTEQEVEPLGSSANGGDARVR